MNKSYVNAMNSGGAVGVPRPLAIPSSLNMLRAAVEELESAVVDLESRTHPLRHQNPATSVGIGEARSRPTNCDVSAEICQREETVAMLAYRVREVLNQMEI